jgi:membrane-bound lytic murein transglycosylase D
LRVGWGQQPEFDRVGLACDRFFVKATCRTWLGAMVPGSALLLALSTAHAADPPHNAKPAKMANSPRSVKGGSKTARGANAAARRTIAGGSLSDDPSGPESPELRALRLAERELFPPAAPTDTWPSEFRTLPSGDGQPRVRASGVPPSEPMPSPPSEGTSDLSWLVQLELPDLPVRWDERVVRYLVFFRDDPRGHTTFASLFRHSGRYRDAMRRALHHKSLPEDLVWVSMIESGFDPMARSPSGSAGLWQFMPETGRIYGLTMDRWIDQRYSVDLATTAAADMLADLHRGFGSWELALAAYNMGHAGLSSVVRRYNTNDFWSLARTEGSLPWETTLYVPKILAASVVAHNLVAFGFGDLVVDAPVETDAVDVPPGTALALVAQTAGCDPKEIEALNPELRAARTPPAGDTDAHYSVKVPLGKGATLAQAIARLQRGQPSLDRYVVRFGETLEQIAATHRTTAQKLIDMNSIAPGEVLRGGTVLLVPKVDGSSSTTTGPAAPTGPKQSVVVPSDEFVYPDRKRVFYRVLGGDTVGETATALHVSVDDLCRWNDLDASARLQEGMTLQAFVAPDADLSRIVVESEEDVRVLAVGSEEFFASLEQVKGFRRLLVAAKAGDTIESIGRHFDVSPRTMERINRRGRGEALRPGEIVIVYLPGSAAPSPAAATVSVAQAASGPLPAPPVSAWSGFDHAAAVRSP